MMTPPGGRVDLQRAKLEHDLVERAPAGELYLLVAEVDEALVGYGRASHVVRPAGRPHEIPTGWYLLGVYVLPRWRRRGLGWGLTRARLAWLRERAEQVWFTTMAENEASIALHREFGFAEVARGVRAPGKGPDPRRVLFGLDLRG